MFGAPRGTEIHRALHAWLNLIDKLRDIQLPFNLRLEGGNLFLRRWILQPVKRASIGNGTDKRGQLERRLRNLFTETRESIPMPPSLGGAGGKDPGCSPCDVKTGFLSVPVKVRIIAHAFIAQLDAKICEVIVVGMGERLR